MLQSLVTRAGLRLGCFFFVFVVYAPALFAQGSLTPPGPPAPTMKTLDQVQPRTPIKSLPFNITQSGSYYFTKNLSFAAASGNAITISASDVTVDLMGFILSSSSGVTGDAIRINPGLRNVAVFNGVIAGTTTVTVSGNSPNQVWTIVAGGFATGINAFPNPRASNCHFGHLRIFGCRADGLQSGEHAVVEQVTVVQNGGFGMEIISGNVINSNAALNGNIGIGCISGSVSGCTATQNESIGILGSAVTNCTSSGNRTSGIFGFSATVSNCNCTGNEGSGIAMFAGSITNCVASSNAQDGIAVTLGSVTSSITQDNGDNGISAPSGVVAFCQSSSNNKNNSGGSDISTAGATRTGNSPTP